MPTSLSFQAIAMLAIRHALTTAGGALVTKGVLDAATLESGIGALMVLSGIAASIISKYKSPK